MTYILPSREDVGLYPKTLATEGSRNCEAVTEEQVVLATIYIYIYIFGPSVFSLRTPR